MSRPTAATNSSSIATSRMYLKTQQGAVYQQGPNSAGALLIPSFSSFINGKRQCQSRRKLVILWESLQGRRRGAHVFLDDL